MGARERILDPGNNRKPRRLTEVPEWGDDVYVRVLSAQDQAELVDAGPPKELPVRVLLHSLVDQDGNRLLTDDDFAALAKQDFPRIQKAFAAATQLNALTQEEVDEATESFGQAPGELSFSE
jgi:hypothetical protein